MARANAFAEIMPPSASTSSSTTTKKVRYDVFINHRGPDTKQTLAASIYRALKLMGLEVFLDEPELDLGDSIPSGIQHAIATSFLHIAILSPRYAESTWCLEELSLMLKSGQTVIPVFYNVDPGELHWIRKEKGAYAEEFSKFEAKNRYRPEKLEDWKSALQKVSHLKGHIVNSEDDKEVLKIISNYVLKYSEKTPIAVAKYSVGLDDILQDFERSVFRSLKKVKIVGITGMGGCGKTTLAKKYYNKMIQSFYRCTFVCDVLDTPTKNLQKRQEKMFQDLGGSKDIPFDSVEEGKAILAEYLRLVQVFIVLDNVDHIEQLDCLLPIKDSLALDSVIVITTRDPGILTSWGIPSNSIYKMKELNPKHAMELFCWHAFQQPYPFEGFECLVKDFLIESKGLPLSLAVLGGLVHGEPKEFWILQLDKVSKSLDKDIKNILTVSFDALDKEEKEIFLDISCFFIGIEKYSAVPVWNESGWSGLGSLETLIDKSLVEVDEESCLRMHDLLIDLGKDISKAWSAYRFWSPQQIIDIIEKQGKESLPIRGIKAQTDEFCKEFMELVRESGRIIKRKPGLKILDVENNYFTEELATLLEGFVWLRWVNFPHTVLPSWLSLKKLRVLELREASKLEEPWSEAADPPVQLRELKIIHAGSFLRFPRSIGFLKYLKKISFDSEGAPIEGLPEEFCHLESLEQLELVGCHKIKSLPSKFGDLTNLRHLHMRGCSGIKGLPEGFCRLQSLMSLELSDCHTLKSLPSKFGDLTNLRHLLLKICSGIECLPEKFCHLQSLEILEIVGCHTLKSLPSKFGDLTKLGSLLISGCSELMIPSETLAQLTGLYHLGIVSCPGLTELVIQPGYFSSSFCNLCSMQVSRCPVSRISISQQCCTSLKSLSLTDNHHLVEIDSLPISVKNILLIRCSKLEIINLNCGLLNLDIRECGELRKIGVENCRSLEILTARVWRKVPHIQSLKDMESLRSVSVAAACHISAFEPCLQTLNREKWPRECIICFRTAPGLEAILKSFTVPGLTLVDSFVWETDAFQWWYVFPKELSSNEAAMICLVINSTLDQISLQVTCIESRNAHMYVNEGKWVYIGVFTQSILVEKEVSFSVWPTKEEVPLQVDCVEMAVLAMGEEKRVVDAFHDLLHHLGKVGDICEGD